MSNTMNRIASDLQKIISESDKKKTSGYDTQAIVTRLDGEIAWVKIPGGEDETPVRRTTNAGVGDNVQVRVNGGRAWLLGNTTNPSTDDTVANIAILDAANASDNAMAASQAAKVALDSANNARINASIAHEMAENATQSAEAAAEQASVAQAQAFNATTSASLALNQLSIVENVVGVLDLLQKNGDYQETSDDIVKDNKWYFVRSGTAPDYVYSVVNNVSTDYLLTKDTIIIAGKTYYTRAGSGTTEDPYVYTAVANPVASELATYYEYSNSPYLHGYYELVGIDEAIQNYVSSHLAIDDQGLWLQNGTDANATRVLLSSTEGVKMYNGSSMIAQYGPTSQIGDSNGFHIKITGNELGFFNGGGVRIAYLNGQQLYITKSVVLQQMDLGTPYGYVDPVTGITGLGQWSWKVHPNGETPSRNNLNLKWVG